MNILLVSHALDFSGAPNALLEMAKSLLRLHHIVSITSLQNGPLITEFINAGVLLYDSNKNTSENYDLVIANTVLAVPPSLNFCNSAEKVLGWIHESEYFFSIIGGTPQNFRLDELKCAAFPAKFQINEFARWMPKTKQIQLNNCVQISSDMISQEASDSYFVCSGHWENRKSQIVLTQLLQNLNIQPEIIFVGANKPNIPLQGKYSFTGPITPFEAKNKIAKSRGVISCAISEVQPLVPIEAMLLRIPVLLSDIPAHRELKELVPEILLFDTSSDESFKANFELLLNQWHNQSLRTQIREKVLQRFNANEFDKNVASLVASFMSA